MPTYTPTTPTLALCADLADAVHTAWNPVAPSAVDWDFFRRYGDGEDRLTKLEGRQVVFFPTEDYDWQNENRGRDLYTHRISCLVVERYLDPGDPPRDWTAERVDFVHTRIVKGLRFTRSGSPSWNPLLVTLGGSVQICDLEKLVTGGKLFYSLVALEFEELVTPT
jgi:hypothetical protein